MFGLGVKRIGAISVNVSGAARVGSMEGVMGRAVAAISDIAGSEGARTALKMKARPGGATAAVDCGSSRRFVALSPKVVGVSSMIASPLSRSTVLGVLGTAGPFPGRGTGGEMVALVSVVFWVRLCPAMGKRFPVVVAVVSKVPGVAGALKGSVSMEGSGARMCVLVKER